MENQEFDFSKLRWRDGGMVRIPAEPDRQLHWKVTEREPSDREIAEERARAAGMRILEGIKDILSVVPVSFDKQGHADAVKVEYATVDGQWPPCEVLLRRGGKVITLQDELLAPVAKRTHTVTPDDMAPHFDRVIRWWRTVGG